MGCVKLNFLICRIDIFNISGTYVDMYPYSVVNITIRKADKLKIMATVSSAPNNPAVGHHNCLSPFISSLLRPYLCTNWVYTCFTSNTYSLSLVRPSLRWNCVWKLFPSRPYIQKKYTGTCFHARP